MTHEPRKCLADAQDAEKAATSRECKNPTKRVPQERQRAEGAVHNMQQESDTLDQGVNAIRTKMFKFLKVKSVVITKLT